VKTSWIRPLALGAILGATHSACLTTEPPPGPLANARVASDYGSYHLARVGLMPFRGPAIEPAQARAMQDAFLFELSRGARFEVVLLTETDVSEARPSDPYTQGAYDLHGVLDVAHRFRLDGLLMTTVTNVQVYTPQALAMQVEMVSCETGLAIWSAQLHLDTSDPALRRRLEGFESFASDDGHGSADAQLTWLSPTRLTRFAAHEVARVL
jgi:hypothetical protein